MSRMAALAAVAAMAFPATMWAAPGDACGELQHLIKATYTFKPSKVSSADRDSASRNMDEVWKTVEDNPKQMAPCLRAALEDPQADAWFRLDGSNLLVRVDPSRASKTLQVRAYLAADLDDVDLQTWVQTLAARALEGFDVSEAGSRWLANPNLKYYLALHGGFEVGARPGALFIFGSMDEAQTQQPLFNIANQQGHPGREAALWILARVATPDAYRALRQVNTAGLSKGAKEALSKLQTHPDLIEPAAKPAHNREELLKVLGAAVRMDWDRIEHLQEERNDLEQSLHSNSQQAAGKQAIERLEGLTDEIMVTEKPWHDFIGLFWGGQPAERDAVAVLRPEDVPLIRLLRRRVIAACNQHAIERYENLSQLLATLTWQSPAKTASP